MAYAGTLITINGKKISKIISYKVSFCKLWGEDSGRSMTGSNKGTLIGIFPKITLKVGRMTDAECAEFLSVVNSANATVRYWDSEKQSLVSNSFYFGDAVDEILRAKDTLTHAPIEVSIIANERR